MSIRRRAALALAACLAPGAGIACPEAAPAAQTLVLAPEAARLGHAVAVVAGGPVPLAACAAAGHVPAAPQVALAGLGGAVVLHTESACDTVLLAAAPEGWHFDDDGGGEGAGGGQGNARLDLGAAPDLLLVWVGTFGPGTCRAVLLIEPAE